MTFAERAEHPIYCKEMTLQWDVEYYQSYIHSYETGQVSNPTDEDYQECVKLLKQAVKSHENYLTMHAEYFI